MTAKEARIEAVWNSIPDSIEGAKQGFIREYSFNMVSDLFLALPLEKQQLWVKEIQQALMAGIEYGIELSNDERYKQL